jgi:catechol 2,3-dioxygenase-like lactoylglutathione lyase family enzyme
VSEWERAKRFYSEVLQAELIERPDGGAHFRFGEQQLNVHGPGGDPHPVARIPVAPGGADLCFRWEGPIEEAVAHLERHGVQVEEGPAPRHGARGRGTSVYFRDPDGNLLEFISYAS